MQRSGQRRIQMDGASNFRDLGGYATADGGSTRWGRVFRADGLHDFTPADLDTFRRLSIASVFDLRGDMERSEAPDPMPSRQLALLGHQQPGVRSGMAELQSRGDGEAFLALQYQRMLSDAGPLLGEMYRSMNRPGGLPTVFHCMGGKDRTGVAAALLLTHLGVDRDTVLDDYDLTNEYRTVDHEAPLLARLTELGMSPDAIDGLISAPRWAMAETLELLESTYGGIQRFLGERAGLSSDELATLRTELIEPKPRH